MTVRLARCNGARRGLPGEAGKGSRLGAAWRPAWRAALALAGLLLGLVTWCAVAWAATLSLEVGEVVADRVSVAGHLSDDAGTGLSGVDVTLALVREDTTVEVTSVRTGADGGFRCTFTLPAGGRYRVHASAGEARAATEYFEVSSAEGGGETPSAPGAGTGAAEQPSGPGGASAGQPSPGAPSAPSGGGGGGGGGGASTAGAGAVRVDRGLIEAATGTGPVIVNVSAVGGAARAELSAEALALAAQRGRAVELRAGFVTVGLPPGALAGLAAQLPAGAVAELRVAEVPAAGVAVSGLPGTLRSALACEVELRGAAATGFREPAVLTFPVPASGVRDPELLTVVRLSGGGPEVLGGRYDAAREVLVCRTRGFSTFVVGEYVRDFADLAGHWAAREVAVLTAKGLLRGVAPDLFDPEATVTRAQAAALLARLYLLPRPTAAEPPSDVRPDDWFCDAVLAVRGAGLMRGVGGNLFAPEEPLTREQMAVVLVNAARAYHPGLLPADEGLPAGFRDAEQVSAWARSAVAAAARMGLLRGRPDGTVGPQDPLTRAEAAALLYRFAGAAGLI